MEFHKLAVAVCMTAAVTLTVATAWAGPGPHKRTIHGTFAGAFSPSTFDPNNDGRPASLSLSSTKAQGGRGTGQTLADVLPALPTPMACPADNTEFPYSSTFSVGTSDNTQDQLISAGGGSGQVCLDPNGIQFTFEYTEDVFGGTGKYAGATGTVEVKGNGVFMSCDAANRCTGLSSGEFSATLFFQ
jgi:hypothetical protein